MPTGRVTMSIYDKLVGATSDGLLPPAVLEHIEPSVSYDATEYWVSVTGDDASDGSEAAPFRTITKALSMVPDLVRAGHVYTITLDSGTWDEDVSLNHRVVYGSVVIQGATTDRELHKVRTVRCDSIIGYLTVQNLTTTLKTAKGQSFRFYRCTPIVRVENVKSESDAEVEKGVEGVIGLIADYGSQVMVRYSDFGGKRYGMRSNYLSRIFSYNNTGSNNTFGLGARWGGIMTTVGTQPTGDTNLTTGSGGMLTHDSGGQIGISSEPGLVDSRGNGDESPTWKRYQINSKVAGINADIAKGESIRVRFRAPQDGYVFVRMAYGGQTSSSGAQSIQKHFYGLLKRATFTPSSSAIISSHSFGSNTAEVTHAGADGVFYLTISPLMALAGRWGLEVELSIERASPAPILEGIELLSA